MYVAGLHSGMGSLSEAMDAQKPVLLETLEEVKELQHAVWDKDPFGGEIDVRYFELPELMTLDQAKEYMLSAHYFEDMEDDLYEGEGEDL